MKKISTTQLSKKLDISTRILFKKLIQEGLIVRKENKWNLTQKGEELGGELYFVKKFGEFIVWPQNFNPFKLQNKQKTDLIDSDSIGLYFNLPKQRVNLILTEIGWIEKAISGWRVTSLGRKVGGEQFESFSGEKYVLWPKGILNNMILKDSIFNDDIKIHIENESKKSDHILKKFRKKFPANLRTKDGHLVRSRAEVIIDNALYDYGLAHAYERRLPIEEDVYSDFYIPSKNDGKAVYIEFWGFNNDSKYLKRKKIKKQIFSKYKLNLIEIYDEHIESLDDYLPRMLLKFNIKVD